MIDVSKWQAARHWVSKTGVHMWSDETFYMIRVLRFYSRGRYTSYYDIRQRLQRGWPR